MITFEGESILQAVKQVYYELVPGNLRPFDQELELEDSATIVLLPPSAPIVEAAQLIRGKLCYEFQYEKFFPFANDIPTPTGQDIIAYEMGYWNEDLIDPCEEAPEGRLRHIAELLRQKASSRRAVINFWRPCHEQSATAPCVTHIVFRVKNDFLEMHAHLRTNDITFLLFMDMQVLSAIHEIAAGWLGLKKGTYVHFVDSLHFHKKYRPLVQKQYKFIFDSTEWSGIRGQA